MGEVGEEMKIRAEFIIRVTLVAKPNCELFQKRIIHAQTPVVFYLFTTSSTTVHHYDNSTAITLLDFITNTTTNYNTSFQITKFLLFRHLVTIVTTSRTVLNHNTPRATLDLHTIRHTVEFYANTLAYGLLL